MTLLATFTMLTNKDKANKIINSINILWMA